MIYKFGDRIIVKLCDGADLAYQRERAARAIESYARAFGFALTGTVKHSGSACGWDIFNQRVAA